MKNKIFKWTLLSGVGLTASALTGSQSLVTFNLSSKISNFTPPQGSKNLELNNQTIANKDISQEDRPHSDDLNIEWDYILNEGWIVHSLTNDGRQKNHIDIPHGVNVIDARAFKDDNNLETISIPDSIIKIDSEAFKNCANLQAIDIPENVEMIGFNTLDGCSKLNASNVKNHSTVLFDWWVLHQTMYKNINGGKYIEEKYINLFNAYNSNSKRFTIIGAYAFSDDHNLEEIGFGEITKICANAFCRCSNLQTIFDFSEVVTIEAYAFSSCKKLKSVTLPETVKNLDEKIFDDDEVEIINNSHVLFDWWVTNKKMTDLGGMTIEKYIEKNHIITTDDLEHKIFNSKGQPFTIIGRSTFASCFLSLLKVDVPDSIELDNGAFDGCANLTTVNLPKNLTSIKKRTFANCEKLVTVTIPDSVKRIDTYAFFDCCELNSIVLPKNVEIIAGYAFSRCKAIKSITIPLNVKMIGRKIISESEIDNVTLLCKGQVHISNEAFEGIKDTTQFDVVYPELVTKLQEVCGIKKSRITQLSQELGDFLVYNNTAIELSQKGKNQKAIVVPDTVNKINDDTFNNCSPSLNTIQLKNKDLELVTQDVFKSIPKQTVYYVDDNSIANKLNQVGITNSKIYLNEENKKNLIVRERADHEGNVLIILNEVAKNANIVEVPSNVDRIDAHAFSGCSNELNAIIFHTTANNLEIVSEAFSDVPKTTNYFIDNENLATHLQKSDISPKKIATVKGDFYYGFSDSAKLFGLSSTGRSKTKLVIPSTVNETIKGSFSTVNPQLNKITINSAAITIDKGTFESIPKDHLYKIHFDVYTKSVEDTLKSHKEINSANVHLISSPTPAPKLVPVKKNNGLSSKSIGIIVGSICFAILLLGLGIGIPMRKQNKINVLNAKLTHRRIDKLSTANALAFKKVVAATGTISQQVDKLGSKMNLLNAAVNKVAKTTKASNTSLVNQPTKTAINLKPKVNSTKVVPPKTFTKPTITKKVFPPKPPVKK